MKRGHVLLQNLASSRRGEDTRDPTHTPAPGTLPKREEALRDINTCGLDYGGCGYDYKRLRVVGFRPASCSPPSESRSFDANARSALGTQSSSFDPHCSA